MDSTSLRTAPKCRVPSIRGSRLGKTRAGARYGNSEGPAVVGYVALVKSGDAESCNCGATDAAHVDTQIALVTDLASANDKSKHIVVEVTPRTRGRYHFPSTATLKKQYYTSA
jgi:hypothetical protein